MAESRPQRKLSGWRRRWPAAVRRAGFGGSLALAAALCPAAASIGQPRANVIGQPRANVARVASAVRMTGGRQAASARRAVRTTTVGRGASRAPTFVNPVFDQDFPDPTVIRAADGWFYAYATQTAIGRRTLNIQVARSRDLVRWQHLGDALPEKPAWASQTQKFWAPHVSQRGGTFYMYYSADPNTLTGLCLAVATAKRAAGPFKDSGRPLKCGESFINIDPMAFDDPRTGKRLLYWGSGFRPIRVQELAADRVSFRPGSEPVELIAPIPDENPDNYQRLIEGAWVVYRRGFYYLFYSGDNCCGERAHYAVQVARSRSATGPFETLAQANKQSNSVVLERNAVWLAPGHNSVVTDAAGRDWIFYHAINVNRRFLTDEITGDRSDRRVMLMDRITYHGGWPQVAGRSPSTTPQPAPVVGPGVKLSARQKVPARRTVSAR